MSHHLTNKRKVVLIAVGFLMLCGLFSTMGNTTQMLDNSSIPDPMETDDDNSEAGLMMK